MSELRWWEKTVEYKFILEAQDRGLSFAMPLSGLEERAADAVFGRDAKLVLVEFKRSKDELASEQKKYKNYQDAEQALNGSDEGLHFLVFGEALPNGQLGIHAHTYFGRTPLSEAMEIMSQGVPEQQFRGYLAILLQHKKDDERGSGSVSPEAVAAVIGLESGGENCSAISLAEYCRRVGLDYRYEARHSASPGF